MKKPTSKTTRKPAKKAAKKSSAKSVKLFSLDIGDKFHFVGKKRVYTINNSTGTRVLYTGFGAKYWIEKNVPVVKVK